jgi:hypothetical protein
MPEDGYGFRPTETADVHTFGHLESGLFVAPKKRGHAEYCDRAESLPKLRASIEKVPSSKS